ncbi:MAG: GAF domain-containing sensor histidine kinase [Anaerolineales bacterium]|nr:GAF domain-containing sensor histidine kinase [Anaerolineales bacterium]
MYEQIEAVSQTASIFPPSGRPISYIILSMKANPAPGPMADVDRLHRISLELMRETSLDAVLDRTASVARRLTNARHAVVALLDDKGDLDRFVYSFSRPQDTEVYSVPAAWWKLIAALCREGTPLFSADVRNDARLAGMTDNRMGIRSALGIPLRLEEKIAGAVILADKQGEGEFTPEDRKGIEILASFAGVAVENALSRVNLQEDERELTERNRELAIFNDVSVAANTTLELEGILATTLDRMMLHFRMLSGQVFLLEEDAQDVRMAMQRGDLRLFYWEKDVFAYGEGLVGRAASSRELTVVVDPPAEPGFDEDSFRANGLRMMIGVPLNSKGRILGVMMLSSTEVMRFTDRQKALLEAVGLSVGTAVENGLLHRKAQRLAVMEERERIGMDLHDGIIQSIYAVGLSLEEGLLEIGKTSPEARSKLERAISGLNAVIRDIREYIADLRPKRFIFDNLAVGLDMLIREFCVNTPISAEAELSEEAGRWLAPAAADALFHIAQEALANVARHARATRLKVSLAQVGDRVVLEVADNGVGFEPARQVSVETHGLANMEERARVVNGALTVASEAGKGTTVRVSIPRIRPQTGNLAGRESRRRGEG